MGRREAPPPPPQASADPRGMPIRRQGIERPGFETFETGTTNGRIDNEAEARAVLKWISRITGIPIEEAGYAINNLTPLNYVTVDLNKLTPEKRAELKAAGFDVDKLLQLDNTITTGAGIMPKDGKISLAELLSTQLVRGTDGFLRPLRFDAAFYNSLFTS